MIQEFKTGMKFERTFKVDRAAVNTETRTVELACSSEQPVERWYGIEILDHSPGSVRLDWCNSGRAPFLCNHETDEQIGVIESARLDADRVCRAVVRFGKSAEAEEEYQDVLDGIRTNVSVGYVVHAYEVTRGVNGAPDTYRITDWEPLENSLVSIPADMTVGVGRSAEPLKPTPEPIPQLKQERTMPEAKENQAADTGAIEARAAESARQNEHKRTNEIFAIGEDHEDIGGLELARAAVREGTSVSEFQTKLLAAKREKAAKGEQVQFGQGARIKDRIEDDAKRGFRNYGDFCASIVRAASDKGVDERLTRAASTFGNEASGPDGGYAVPPEFAREITSIAYAEDSLLSRCDNTPISGNNMSFPKDETTPWGSTGVTAAWESEGNQSTPKKPALGESQLKLRKLKVLVAASDELLADAPAMSSYITRKMGEAVDWKVNDAIVNGTGAGQPLGIRVAASIVSQAKEASQTAVTINAANLAKMYGRVLKGAGANLVWLLNPDGFNQIATLNLNNNPIWMPANEGFKGAPDGLLLGRPVVLTDTCATLGTVGDIILANMSGYRAITKAGGAEFATSMHLWFDQDLMAFRLIFRMDGQPALAAPVTPPNSSVTRSHFVSLATRA